MSAAAAAAATLDTVLLLPLLLFQVLLCQVQPGLLRQQFRTPPMPLPLSCSAFLPSLLFAASMCRCSCCQTAACPTAGLTGTAPLLPRPPSPPCSEMLPELLPILRERPFVFFGHSMGSWLAYQATQVGSQCCPLGSWQLVVVGACVSWTLHVPLGAYQAVQAAALQCCHSGAALLPWDGCTLAPPAEPSSCLPARLNAGAGAAWLAPATEGLHLCQPLAAAGRCAVHGSCWVCGDENGGLLGAVLLLAGRCDAR